MPPSVIGQSRVARRKAKIKTYVQPLIHSLRHPFCNLAQGNAQMIIGLTNVFADIPSGISLDLRIVKMLTEDTRILNGAHLDTNRHLVTELGLWR